MLYIIIRLLYRQKRGDCLVLLRTHPTARRVLEAVEAAKVVKAEETLVNYIRQLGLPSWNNGPKLSLNPKVSKPPSQLILPL